MSRRFNSGMGGNTCDRCNVLLCSGFFPKPYYGYDGTEGPHQHYCVPKRKKISSEAVQEGTEADVDNSTYLHTKEYCKECATVILIDGSATLVTAKELYNL